MDTSVKGLVLAETTRQVDPLKLEELATALATATASETARLVPYFGPTMVGGEQPFVDKLGLDFSRALLGGIDYEWVRPFEAGETISAHVFVEEAYEKANKVFVVVTTEFTEPTGSLIHRQRATFIERGTA